MLSDGKTPIEQSRAKAPAYEYPPPGAPGEGPLPAQHGGNASTLERLWSPGASSSASGPAAPSEEEIHARELCARTEGRTEGLAHAKAEMEKKLAAEKLTLAQAVQQFFREQATYFQKVEAEVVGLAMAIARKILHREAQVDPLLLAGVVRVGLDKLAAGTHVRLRVHPDQVAVWRGFFSQHSDLQSLPELMGDPTLGLGQCVLETELGSTDLTLESQLKEIEQGFFDLLAQRPQKPT